MNDDEPLRARSFPYRFLGALHAWVWVKKPEPSKTEPQSADYELITVDSSAAVQNAVQQLARRIAGPLAACLYCLSLI